MSNSNAPDRMVTVEEFAKSNGVSPESVIEGIRSAQYIGRKLNGQWYIDPNETSAFREEKKMVEPKNKEYSTDSSAGAKAPDFAGATAIIALGALAAILFFVAGYQISAGGQEMADLRSVSGSTVAEYFYQGVGAYGIAFAKAFYAMGFLSFGISLGISSILKNLSASNPR